jgi:DNA mismatch repair ATPase MutS
LFELQPPAAGSEKLRRELDAIDPDNLTPKQALEILYRLKKKT